MERHLPNQVKQGFGKSLVIALGLTTLLGAAEIEGHYRNPEYGYSIEIPKGLKASTDAAPAPQHGFRIGSAKSFLWVDGSYNAEGAHSATEILKNTLDDVHSQAKVVSTSRSKTHLGTLAADAISIRYRPTGSEQMTVREEVVALRPGTSGGVVYIVGMIVPAGDYTSQRAVLKRLIDSFHTEKLPQ